MQLFNLIIILLYNLVFVISLKTIALVEEVLPLFINQAHKSFSNIRSLKEIMQLKVEFLTYSTKEKFPSTNVLSQRTWLLMVEFCLQITMEYLNFLNVNLPKIVLYKVSLYTQLILFQIHKLMIALSKITN